MSGQSADTMEQENPWVDGLTISQVLRKTAENFPENDALVFPKLGFRCNYSQLDEAVDDVAKGLIALGINKGEHVAMWATNVPEWPLLQLACARIGAVFVTINPANRSSEMRYVLTQSDAKALFLIDQFKSSNYIQIINEVCPELVSGAVQCEAFPKLKTVVSVSNTPAPGFITWNTMLEQGRSVDSTRLHMIEKTLKPNEPINIQYTSGTTGFPKAAILSHRNILMNGYYVTGCQRITEKDRMCIPVPYYHCFGCVMGTLGAITRGAAMIIPAEYFDPKATLEAIEKEHATTIYGVPTMFIAMLEYENFPTYDLSSLRSGIMAGSSCPIEVMKKVVSLMGVKEITIAYGQTETSPVITQTRVDDPLEVRVETVGRPLPGVEVKIIDLTTKKTVAPREQGELCARGHGTMIGYYNNEKGSRECIDDEHWVHTGDLAIRREDGNYIITGRIREMIIRGGENIYPREIEEFLYTHEAIEQVAVFGLPDEKFGEEVAAWIKLHHGHEHVTAEDIKAYCKDKIAYYKVPKHIRFVQEFPMTISGKLQKFKMREAMLAK